MNLFKKLDKIGKIILKLNIEQENPHKKNNLFLAITLVYLVICLFGIWVLVLRLLPSGYIIAGHDSGLALDSKNFLETRFYSWDERINFGEDNSPLFGSLTIHSIDYLTSLLANTPYAGNQVNLFFWLSAIFVAALFFAYQIKERLGKTFVFIYPNLIFLNFYIFQSVFILERAKYSLVVGSLLFLGLTARFFDRKISLTSAVVFSTIIFAIFNGGSWLGLPLFGGLLIITLTLLVFLVVDGVKSKNSKRALRFVYFLVLTAVGYISINSYALFPYLGTFFIQDYQIIQDTSTLQANKSWLDYITQGSSFLNMLRLQGIPDWYTSKFTISVSHPFAEYYSVNPIFLSLSYLFPIIAFGSLVLVRSKIQKSTIGLLASISLVSLVFMAGTKPPLGFIYEFFYSHIPGFVIFRSSFYKFGYAFIIAYSALMTFTLSQLVDILTSRINYGKIRLLLKTLLVGLIVLAWISYHFKLLNPIIFNWRSDFSTKVKVPSYVNDYKEYVRDENIDFGRVLILPRFNGAWLSDGYNWGYWSLSTIHYSLTKQPVIANTQNSFFTNENWVDALFESFLDKDVKKALEIARRLGINRFLVKEDAIVADVWSGGEDPKIYEEILESSGFVEKEKDFGRWKLYKIKGPNEPLIFADNNFTQLPDNKVNSLRQFIGTEKTYLKNITKEKSILPEGFINKRITRIDCKSCLLEEPVPTYQLVWPNILPSSFLFPLKILNENYQLKKTSDSRQKTNTYFGLVVKRTSETEAMIYYKIPERFILDNLKLVDKYLDEISKNISQSSNPNEDFAQAKLLIDNIHSVESKLAEQLSSDKQGLRGEAIKNEIAKTLWHINELKKIYDPILKNLDRWENEKIYEIDMTSVKQSSLFIKEQSLPVDRQGKFILPEIMINGNKVDFLNPKRDQNWISIPTNQLTGGRNKLEMNFKGVGNIFDIKGHLMVTTPEGQRNCYVGKINSPILRKNYLLKVKTDDQALTVFSKVDTNDELKNFLEWKNAIRIEGIYDDNYFRSYYVPIAPVNKLNIYICGEHQDLPKFREFNIQEVFTPQMVSIEKLEDNTGKLPEVSYSRIDPTRFNVQVKSAQNSFILIMNQKYSPLWKLVNLKTGKEITSKIPLVDSYANSWLISDTGDLELSIEYSPQKYFEIGLFVSGVVIFILIGILAVSRINHKNKQHEI